jgi:serine/threonine protein kinase
MRTWKTMGAIVEEIFILEHLPSYPRLLVKRNVYYERGDTWFTSPENEDDERYGLPARLERVIFIIQHFARLTLTELLPKLSPDLKIMAFHQLLQGVHALYNAKPFLLLHRDLKLSNIGVVSYDDYSIVVVIGQTIQAQPHKPIGGKAGTRGYQAPEMPHQIHDPARYLVLRNYWSQNVCSRVAGFCHPHSSRFAQRSGNTEPARSTTPEHLIAQMLIWESGKRISASDALLHPCFATVVKRPSSLDLPAGKRIRED